MAIERVENDNSRPYAPEIVRIQTPFPHPVSRTCSWIDEHAPARALGIRVEQRLAFHKDWWLMLSSNCVAESLTCSVIRGHSAEGSPVSSYEAIQPPDAK